MVEAKTPIASPTSRRKKPAPRTIERICHDWRVSHARFELECIEAEDDETANRNAIDGEAKRAKSLLEDIEAAEISSCSDAEEAHDHNQVMAVLDRRERMANQAKEAA